MFIRQLFIRALLSSKSLHLLQTTPEYMNRTIRWRHKWRSPNLSFTGNSEFNMVNNFGEADSLTASIFNEKGTRMLSMGKNQEHLETQTQQGHFPNTSHLILKCSVWALGAFLGGTVLPFHTNPKHVSWKTGAVPTTLTTCFSCLVDSEQSVPIQVKLLNTLFKDFHVTPKILHAIIPFPLVLALKSKV